MKSEVPARKAKPLKNEIKLYSNLQTPPNRISARLVNTIQLMSKRLYKSDLRIEYPFKHLIVFLSLKMSSSVRGHVRPILTQTEKIFSLAINDLVNVLISLH